MLIENVLVFVVAGIWERAVVPLEPPFYDNPHLPWHDEEFKFTAASKNTTSLSLGKICLLWETIQCTPLLSMKNALLSQPKFWHCLENPYPLLKIIPTIHHNHTFRDAKAFNTSLQTDTTNQKGYLQSIVQCIPDNGKISFGHLKLAYAISMESSGSCRGRALTFADWVWHSS